MIQSLGRKFLNSISKISPMKQEGHCPRSLEEKARISCSQEIFQLCWILRNKKEEGKMFYEV